MNVDVVVIAYNEERYINECIDAILKNAEVGKVIVVDDASTDKTLDIVKSRPEREEGKLVVLSNKINMGRGYSRVKGFKEATTDIVAIVDGDTIVREDWLRIMIPEMEKRDKKTGQQVDLATGLIVFGSKNPNVFTEYIGKVMDNILSESNATSGMLFRKYLLDEIPMDISIRDGEDMDWICNLMEANKTINMVEYYIGTHYDDSDVFDFLKRYYQYGRNNAMLHEKHPEVIKITDRDKNLDEYTICTILENLRLLMKSMGFKSYLLENKEKEYGK